MNPARPWLLLRGLTRETRHWGDFPARLDARTGSAGFHCIDFPGNGRWHALPSPLSVTAMLEACRTELRSQSITGPYRVLAVSLGGMVALEWARRYPNEVACAALINSSVAPYAPLHHRLRVANYPALLRLLVTDDAHWRETTVLRLTSRSLDAQSDAGRDVVALWQAIYREAPVTRLNALRQLVAAARYRATSPPNAPLLLLASRRDALVNPECSRRLAQAWNLPLAEHPDAGHDLALDAPEWLLDRLVDWLSKF